MYENLLKDVFLVETGMSNVWLVYAPLKMILFAVNDAGAEAFLDLRKGIVLENSNPLVKTLRTTGLLDNDWVEKELPKPSVAPHADITICPTFRCSLRCLYCFAFGGERLNDLSLEATLKAVDLAMLRGRQGGIKKSRLTWHGGGEPTLAWGILTKASDYYRKECDSAKIEGSLTIVSNGVWSPRIFDWMVENIDKITISCDGPPDIQNKQRPMTKGYPSAQIVYQSLQGLREWNADFGIRATITEYNVRRMPEMVQFFYDLCQPRTLQFERLAVCGRCESSGITAGSAEDYIKYFCEAFDLARSLGINLSCSGVSIFRKTAHYCGAGGRTLCVTPEGFLTTCHRVDSLQHPLSAQFVYGCWNGDTFSCEGEKLVVLSEMNVYNFPWCTDCFCKFTCAGGCAAARFADTGSLFGQYQDDRCRIVRELTRHRLIAVAKERGLFNNF